MAARKKSGAKKRGRKKPVAGARIERADWTAKAVRLAIKGWSSRRIAPVVGKTHTAVLKALAKEFERARPSDEEIEAARNVHREKLLHREARLNRLIRAHWSIAVGAPGTGGIDAAGFADPEAVALGAVVKSLGSKYDSAKVVIDADKGLDRVHASLARLDGLDAPTKQEMTGKDGAPLIENTAADDVLSLLARLATEGEAGGTDPKPDA